MENTPNKRKISPTVQHPAARWAFVLVLCAALGVVVSYYWRVFYGLDARGLAPLAVTGFCVGLSILAGAAALLLQYGQEPEESCREIAPILAKNLTKSQIMRTIELLQKYRGECTYNVGTGHVLGAIAVELEGIL